MAMRTIIGISLLAPHDDSELKSDDEFDACKSRRREEEEMSEELLSLSSERISL